MSISTEARRTIGEENSEVATPRVRSTLRRLVFWVVIVVILAIFAVLIIGLTGSPASTARLSGTNPKPVGAKALLQVLRQDGVDVSTPRTLTKALDDASAAPTETTIVLYDKGGILKSDQLDQLSDTAAEIVLIEPSFAQLRELAPSVHAAGFAPSVGKADCDYQPAVRAGSVAGLGKEYRLDSGADGTSCFGTDGAYGFVRLDSAQGAVSVLGSATMFTNGSILRAGNAAFALGLLGHEKHLVWYLPSFADYHATVDGVIPNPPWVGLLIALAAITGLAAAFWRGRRLGPIVVERLPVFVRANETTEGRARLYQKASARLHVIDALRIGTLSRLATTCGLSRRATVDEIVGAVCAATGDSRDAVRGILIDTTPRTDADLVRLSDALLDLEKRTATATRP